MIERELFGIQQGPKEVAVFFLASPFAGEQLCHRFCFGGSWFTAEAGEEQGFDGGGIVGRALQQLGQTTVASGDFLQDRVAVLHLEQLRQCDLPLPFARASGDSIGATERC